MKGKHYEKSKNPKSSDFFSDVFDNTMRSSNENPILVLQKRDNPLESIHELPVIGKSAA